jgi:tRNA-Thr(GGU) m(6)t(6)A37 methyltransferase TsaA
MIHVLATIQLAPGTRDRFLREFQAVEPLVRSEAGCLEYGAAIGLATGLPRQAAVDDDEVMVVEKWASVDALTAHLSSEHMRAYRARITDIVRDTRLEVLTPAGPPGGWPMRPIGRIHTPYTGTAEIPKGVGARHDADGVVRLDAALERGLADIEGFSHLFLIWLFDRAGPAELDARPPSDDRSHGVFATRSPRRPNAIGLTVVRLLRRQGGDLHVRGVDMLDGTPLLDIKPYLSGVPDDELRRGWLDEAERRSPQRSGS